MKRFLKYNLLLIFFGLFFSTLIVGLIKESNDMNAAGMYLVVFLFPIFGVMDLNLFIVGILGASEVRHLRTLGLVLCPIILVA